MQNKLIALFLKLSSINLAIDAEHKRAAPDWMRLFRLKRIRLALKDRVRMFREARENKRGHGKMQLSYANATVRMRPKK